MVKFYKISFLLFLFFFLFSFTQTSFAADLNLSPSQGSFKVGDTIVVRIMLSSTNQSANAVSANLLFSNDVLTLSSVSKSNSLISLWAQEPTYSNANGTVDLEGVILSGYTGGSGTILTLSFKAKAVGSANIKFLSSSILANDGQGTNILNNTRPANFSIAKAEEKVVPVVPEPAPTTETKAVANVQIQEIKKKNDTDAFAKFLVTSVDKKSKTSYEIKINDDAYPWENQDGGVYTTPPLPKGKYTIEVSMTATNNEVMKDTTTFSINSLLVPSFTDYSKEIKENEYIVVRGLADPNIDIALHSNRILPDGADAINEVSLIQSDDKGIFTYVSESRTVPGVYIITANSRSISGAESEKATPIKISVDTKTISFSTSIMNTLSVVIPIIGLLILFILLLIWGWYRILNYRQTMHKRLTHTKALVAKSFSILNEDMNAELQIFKKIKAGETLNPSEKSFLTQFKKDIESAERAIVEDIKIADK